MKCTKALNNSRNYARDYESKLIIFDDHSDPDIVEVIKHYADLFIPLVNTGNSVSLHTVYNYAKNCDDLIYFLEDDYLHELSAIKEMLDFYYEAKIKLVDKEVAVFPMDCNDRYKPQYLRPSFIVPGNSRYWRTIDSTTGTNLVSRTLFDKWFECFNKFADYGVDPYVHEENTINNIWRSEEGAVCFSPIPTLAYHLQIEEHLPLYTNYRLLWESLS